MTPNPKRIRLVLNVCEAKRHKSAALQDAAANFQALRKFREVLECGTPVPLSSLVEFART